MVKARWGMGEKVLTEADRDESAVSLPALPFERYREKVLVLFTESGVREMDHAAGLLHMNRSEFIRGAVAEKLGRMKDNE